jgi:hypothetical protein
MSNSVILKNILEDESSELRQDIISFMESKVNEFSSIMKSNIEKAITEKLDDFYKKKIDDLDSILFDKDGADIVKKTISFLNNCMSYHHFAGVEATKKKINEINKSVRTHGYKCFVLHSCHYRYNQGNDNNYIYVFKQFMITNIIPAGYRHGDQEQPQYSQHNLPNDILFTIKHFQIPESGGFEGSGLKIYNEHPEYFNTNCCDFETVCKRERQLMDKQKETLEDLIKQNTNNIEYYKTLETQIREVESEKEKVQQEYKKIKEEKEKMRIVRQKLAAMKLDLEKEKKEFEEQKHKMKVECLDIDKYFENDVEVKECEGEGDNIQ